MPSPGSPYLSLPLELSGSVPKPTLKHIWMTIQSRGAAKPEGLYSERLHGINLGHPKKKKKKKRLLLEWTSTLVLN